jgi:hypothetical protein
VRHRRLVGPDQNILADQVRGFSLAADMLYRDAAGIGGAPGNVSASQVRLAGIL